MKLERIVSLGPELADFLDEFADCFGRSEPRRRMAEYVRGQLSELPRQRIEPIALAAGPRTLQEFLRTDVWDHARMRNRVQQIVAVDHNEPQSIGIIDDSGHAKKGRHTACVNRHPPWAVSSCCIHIPIGDARRNRVPVDDKPAAATAASQSTRFTWRSA